MDEYALREVEAIAPMLAAFDVAAAEGHVTRASDLLRVPQSSVSRRLRSLEKQVGVPLFQPAGRGIALTPQGRELFDRVHGLVRALDDAVSVVRAGADPDSGHVRFGFPLTLGPVSIPALIAEFNADVPRIRLDLVQAHGEALADAVRAGRLDLAVMIPPPDDLPTIPLRRQRILLHVAATHRLAGRSVVDVAELADEKFVASPSTYQLRALLETWCAEAGFEPRVFLEITEFETLRALVGRGLGVALLPAAEVPHPGVVAIALSGERDRAVGLASGRHRPTPAVARLRDHIVDRYAVGSAS